MQVNNTGIDVGGRFTLISSMLPSNDHVYFITTDRRTDHIKSTQQKARKYTNKRMLILIELELDLTTIKFLTLSLAKPSSAVLNNSHLL
jgi:hypothetical protein